VQYTYRYIDIYIYIGTHTWHTVISMQFIMPRAVVVFMRFGLMELNRVNWERGARCEVGPSWGTGPPQ